MSEDNRNSKKKHRKGNAGQSSESQANKPSRKNDISRGTMSAEDQAWKIIKETIPGSKGKAGQKPVNKSGIAKPVDKSRRGTQTQSRDGRGTYTQARSSKGEQTQHGDRRGMRTQLRDSKGAQTQLRDSRGTQTQLRDSMGVKSRDDKHDLSRAYSSSHELRAEDNKRDYNPAREMNNASQDKGKSRSNFRGRTGALDQGSDNKRSIRKSGCPHIRQCGSCQMMQQDYSEHLMDKQKQVNSLINKFCKVETILGMEQPYHYRNKVHAVFDHDRKGNPISGIYEEGTHNVIPIDSCLIHNKKADEIIVSIRGMLKSFKIKTYDEDTGYGLIRHVLVRTGFNTGEIMVVLVMSSPIFPSKNNFVKALRQQHPEITTIILNVNDKNTSMILGEKEQVIYGKGFIEDKLCDKVFRISPKSFYQINPVQTEVIYKKAMELAGLSGKETAIDAYCGIGTIGLIASEHVKKVIGVELNKDAVRDAINNAKRNQITNIEFYNQDAGEFMSQLAEHGEKVDVVFLDPPRAGSDEKFLNSLCTLKPEKVVYISCNPVTLERDLLYLTKKGYKAQVAVPVDMFPWTGHVETVVFMSRKDK